MSYDFLRDASPNIYTPQQRLIFNKVLELTHIQDSDNIHSYQNHYCFRIIALG